MGRRPKLKGNIVDGMVVVDKPSGMSSFDVVSAARRAYNCQRAGHTGTLDPAATGVLVVCFGTATRFVSYLTGLDKGYRGVAKLGVRTSTDDAEGEPLSTSSVSTEHRRVAVQALRDMVGPLSQVPPQVSAIKMDGKRAYARVRDGEEVIMEPRDVVVRSVEIDPDDSVVDEIHFDSNVSKGTFIRSMARDAGDAAGCGGHLSSLRRTAIGALDLSMATPLDSLGESEEIRATALRCPSIGLGHLPSTELDDETLRDLGHGKLPPAEGWDAEPLVVARAAGRFVGLIAAVPGADGRQFWKVVRLLPTAELLRT
ncbi:MAG: tRNA pseudouridine55 synthase [Bradymonadia bacterium]|jgi:tRNA pseudouridine55 synthase